MDSDGTLVVDEGLTIFVEVRSNPTTGYEWDHLETDDCKDVIRVEQSYLMDESPEEMMGVGGTHTFAITGL